MRVSCFAVQFSGCGKVFGLAVFHWIDGREGFGRACSVESRCRAECKVGGANRKGSRLYCRWYLIIVLGIFTWGSHRVSASYPPCAYQNLTPVTLVPPGPKVFLDLIPWGDLHRSPEQADKRSSVKRPHNLWRQG